MDELRALLGERVSERRSWSARLAADISTAAGHLATAGPPQAVEDGEPAALSAGSGGTAVAALPPANGQDGQEARSGQESWSGQGRRSGQEAAGSSPAGGAGGALALGRAEAAGQEPSGEGEAQVGSGGVAKRMAGAERALTGTLCAAAGVPVVVEAVAKGHRHRAVVATGWPVTRWIRKFRPDPLRRLRLGGMAPKSRSGGGQAAGEIVGRTSVPAASAVQRAQVETAVRDVGEVAAAGLPAAWAVAVRQAARSRARELADAVDRAVATTSAVGTRRPRWWRAVNGLQWLVFAAMLAGALWLGVLFGMDYLRLPQPPLPTVGVVPWPTVLLVGGALAGVLVALLSRLAAWAGGRRRARRTGKALRASIGQVGRELVLEPVDAELDTYARFTEALDLARTPA
ncbi:hypothetical protein ACFQ0B_15560 [Nonomuraea thailandensis]